MKAQSATEKTARNTRIAEAVSRHAVGAAQKPAMHGPLEVTATGLVLHLAPEFFGEPAAKRRRKYGEWQLRERQSVHLSSSDCARITTSMTSTADPSSTTG